MYMQRAQQGQSVSNDLPVAAQELPFEFMLNALRLKEGFDQRLFTERTGLPMSKLDDALGLAVTKGWLLREGGRITPTVRGFDFLNDVQQLFLANS